jgi:RNA polymerase sporulation-specific sigma factor
MPGKDLLVARISQKAQSQVQVDDYFLIALAKSGDRNAYDRIVRRYYGFVRLKASSYFLAGGDADDLVQEGLVGLYKAVRDYRSDRESSFRNFAELCITRQIITAVKTATRNKHSPLNQYVSFSATPAGSNGDGEPTLESRVLALYLDGRPYEEIAARLTCDAKTVDNALQRVKRKVGLHLVQRAVLN